MRTSTSKLALTIVLGAFAAGTGTAWAQDAPAAEDVVPEEIESAPTEANDTPDGEVPAMDDAGDDAGDDADAGDAPPPASGDVTPEEIERAPGEAAGDPFADMDIDLGAAGTSVEEAQAFYDGLSAEEQEEVRIRCGDFSAADADAPGHVEAGDGAVFCGNLIEGGVLGEAAAQ